jgi:dipeptidase E
MRMLLTSNGVHNDLIRRTLLDLLDKPVEEASIVAVIDAILPFPGDNTRTLLDLDHVRSLGWKEFDLMSLFAGPSSVVESRLRSADVIFCYGGSNHWLAHAWNSTGLAPVLAELLDEKVYLGWSAGSMIFSRRQADTVEAFDDQREVELFELETVAPAVPLFDWFVICHRGAAFQPQVTDDWVAERAAQFGEPVYFIDDDTALLVRDPEAAPEVVSTGEWRLFDGGGSAR